jgi:hypothetical protein
MRLDRANPNMGGITGNAATSRNGGEGRRAVRWMKWPEIQESDPSSADSIVDYIIRCQSTNTEGLGNWMGVGNAMRLGIR